MTAMTMTRTLSLFLSFLLAATAAAKPTTYQVTGMFMKEREEDLREAFSKMPDVKLLKIDFANSEATLEYDAKLAKQTPEQVLQQLDNQLRNASGHTFGLKPRRTVPLDKLTLITIPVGGLDCKACTLAAYEAVYKLDGVERATATFREGLVTAHIDPAKTDRSKLEAALKQKGVEVKKTP
jgi:cation transport ATPase